MNPRLETLLNRWLDGELAPPEAAAVQRMLVEDPEARRAYYELLMVDRMLDEHVEGASSSRGVIDTIAGEMALGHPRRRFPALYLAVAAAVVLSLFAVFFYSKRPPAGQTGPLITGSSDSRITIAQRQDTSQWAVGELLRLERGAASVRLNPQVSANFDGPAAIELMDRLGNIRMLEGMASFEADAGGNNFEVHVPGGIVRDMRARFSTEVLADGATNLRVDSGFLEIKPRGAAEAIPLRSGDAVRFEPNGKATAIRLPNQHFRSGLSEKVALFRDEFSGDDGLRIDQLRPDVGQPWKVIYEENPTFIRHQTLDTSTGARRIVAPLAPHDSSNPRTVYVFTFHLVPPSYMVDKVKAHQGTEFISLADGSGETFLSIFASAANGHRWQLRDEKSKALTGLTPVCALWAHALTLCYDLGGRVTLHDGATAQSPIIAELRVANPVPVGGIAVGNGDGGDLALSGIEASLLPARAAKAQ